MTIEELGQQTKAKYPQYAKYSDAQVGQKVLEKYPQYQSQITQKQNLLEKISNSPINTLLGGAPRVVQDISTGLAQRQTGATESQNAALDMQAKLAAMARNADPETQARLNKVASSMSQNISQQAGQQAGQYSSDVQQNPLLRGVRAGTGIAGTADLASMAAGAVVPQTMYRVGPKIPILNNIPEVSQTTPFLTNALKGASSKTKNAVEAVIKHKQVWGEARRVAATTYDDVVDIAPWKKDAAEAISKQLKIDHSTLAKRSADDVLASLDDAKSVSDVLDRVVQWGDNAYTGKNAIKAGARPQVYNAVLRALKQHMVDEAPEVAKYTNLLRLSYQVPANVRKLMYGAGATAGGLAAIKYLLSGGNSGAGGNR